MSEKRTAKIEQMKLQGIQIQDEDDIEVSSVYSTDWKILVYQNNLTKKTIYFKNTNHSISKITYQFSVKKQTN